MMAERIAQLVEKADWFISAIFENGSVNESLDAVLRELDMRASFVRELQKSLGGDAIDRVTTLSKDLRRIENTLAYRLPILVPERTAAWFRVGVKPRGSLIADMIWEPIFSNYHPSDVAKVRSVIRTSYVESRLPQVLIEPGCLWYELLTVQTNYIEIVTLDGDFKGARLDRLPDGLDAQLDCRSLQAFLRNVRGELENVRERLDQVFDKLWQKSDLMWECQKREPADAASQYREQFRQRRRQGARCAQDTQAMDIMGLDAWPEAKILRTRYLELARQRHPDAPHGSDEAFKDLNKAYHHLQEQLLGKPVAR